MQIVLLFLLAMFIFTYCGLSFSYSWARSNLNETVLLSAVDSNSNGISNSITLSPDKVQIILRNDTSGNLGNKDGIAANIIIAVGANCSIFCRPF
jgi:hypothetical protein